MSEISDQVAEVSKRDYGVDLLDSLADKASGTWTGKSNITPSQLRIYFERSLYLLQNVREKTLQDSRRLEIQCREANSEFLTNMKMLSAKLSEANLVFKELDSKINEVSGKIIHLGDQLERKNAPRHNLKEARDLILEFSKSLGAGGGSFANVSVKSQADEAQLIEKAASIRTLSALCLELPDDERFLGAKQRVTVAWQNLENLLVKRFRENFATGNDEMMRRIAEVLAYSKSHSGCADVFIEETLKTLPADLGNLSTLPDLLAEAERKIMKIFFRSDTVVFHLIQVLFAKNLKAYLHSKVNTGMPPDIFLTNLYTAYLNLDRLVFQLIDRLQLISDDTQLVKLLDSLASDLLSNYTFIEVIWLKEHLTGHLSAYYASQGHVERNITSGEPVFPILGDNKDTELQSETNIQAIKSRFRGIRFLRKFLPPLRHGRRHKHRLSEFRRGVTNKLHLFSDKEATPEGILLSQDVAVNMLDDVRQSAKRCLLLAKPDARPQFGQQLFDMLAKYFVTKHIDYGITLALHALSATDAKAGNPNIAFFAAVKEGSTLFNFFEKAVNEFIGPLFNESLEHLQECASRRQTLQRSLEAKFSSGLESCLNLTLARVQAILSGEQKKTDYKGDLPAATVNAFNSLPSASTACLHVSTFIQTVIAEARANLDGQNLVNFMNELGIRFHRLLTDHFYSYSFSDSGAFVAMQDVTAYRDVARELQSPTIDYLFDILLKLMNLMLIKPQNVRQVWQDYEASGIPNELLCSFLQLRTDYKKSARLQSHIKRYLER